MAGTLGTLAGSDSSMDDCNLSRSEAMVSDETGSDSSMDDCNMIEQGMPGFSMASSDSSMDDCNHGVAYAVDADHRCSDSSMDDCNLAAPVLGSWDPRFRFLYGRL